MSGTQTEVELLAFDEPKVAAGGQAGLFCVKVGLFCGKAWLFCVKAFQYSPERYMSRPVKLIDFGINGCVASELTKFTKVGSLVVVFTFALGTPPAGSPGGVVIPPMVLQ